MISKYKIFSSEYFSEMKMISGVWLHHNKCFGKYKVFDCVSENPLENTFSHIFSASKQIL